MTERRYTVKELDELRAACENRWLFGTTNFDSGWTVGRSYNPLQKDKAVEELVRTHMMAGHTAEDIYTEDILRRSASQCQNDNDNRNQS